MNLRTFAFIAASTVFTCAMAQNNAQTTSGCPADWTMTDKQLQGEWQATITAQNETAHISLGPHPEWQGTVKGTIERSGASHPMVGDVNQGTVTLEESADGQRITGTWLGEVLAASCGREIRGSFQTDEAAPQQEFVMRKLP